MEIMRAGHRSLVRLSQDDPHLYPWVWEEVPAGSPCLPFAHKFGSRVWDRDTSYAPVIGEQPGRPYKFHFSEPSDCEPTIYGDPEWLRSGVPLEHLPNRWCYTGSGNLYLIGRGDKKGRKNYSGVAHATVVGESALSRRTRFAGEALVTVAGRESRLLRPTYEGEAHATVAGDFVDPADVIDDCPYCPDGAWQTYDIIVFPATGSAAPFAGAWTLDYQGSCTWEAEINDITVTSFWYSPGGTFPAIAVLFGDLSRYDFTLTSFDGCLGDRTLTKTFGSDDWPDTIDLVHGG